MKRKNLRLCIDRVIPLHLKRKAAELALAEHDPNRPPHKATMFGASRHPLKIALETGKRWWPGRTLGVHFMDGSAVQRERTEQHATVWTKYANVKLNFAAGAAAEVRVSFEADTGSWSAVGTDALLRDYFPLREPTMNYGWLRDDTDEDEYRRVVLHEFGHALAAIHEHQNPRGGIEWNLAAVYKYFKGDPNNWSKPEIDSNVVQKYSLDQLNATRFDPRSIMLYSFPAELLASGKATRSNTTLSTGDKRYIGKMYPKPAPRGANRKAGA